MESLYLDSTDDQSMYVPSRQLQFSATSSVSLTRETRVVTNGDQQSLLRTRILPHNSSQHEQSLARESITNTKSTKPKVAEKLIGDATQCRDVSQFIQSLDYHFRRAEQQFGSLLLKIKSQLLTELLRTVCDTARMSKCQHIQQSLLTQLLNKATSTAQRIQRRLLHNTLELERKLLNPTVIIIILLLQVIDSWKSLLV
jgi:hypothetical protein